jgi:hypothetical protein
LAEPPAFPVRPFSVAEYHRLAEAGVLAEDEPVELLEGWIVPMMMRNPSHDATIELVEAALRSRLPNGWRVRVQSAVTTADSEPEPDAAVVRGAIRDYLDHHPAPADVALVVEVAESSLERDRQKLRLYARAGVPICWIVNLVDSRVEVYSEPNAEKAVPAYRQQATYAAGDRVPLVVDAEPIATIPAGELLP